MFFYLIFLFGLCFFGYVNMSHGRVTQLTLTLPKNTTMPKPAKIILKPGKEAAVKRFHPWIFSGALPFMKSELEEGEIVEVFSYNDEYLATGHYCRGSIAVKVFSFKQVEVNAGFWKERLSAALALRKKLGLSPDSQNDAYRLVNMEGDGFPGLIIDIYNTAAVIQTHTAGMYNARHDIALALKDVFGEQLKVIYDKSSETFHDARGATHDEILFGEIHPVTITETGHQFVVDMEKGQKTGFFLDQRGNRMFAQFYGKGRKVLNAFCYSGAFSVYALQGGATSVHSVDSSRQAIAWTKENILLNGIPDGTHSEEVADVKQFLTQGREMYDMIILDPPAFAKHHNISHNALQAYIYINAQAMKHMNTGGILFTFSCSQAINREMFRSAIQAAAIETGKKVKILHQLSQGPDHPVSIFHPEGEYLKGLILEVE